MAKYLLIFLLLAAPALAHGHFMWVMKHQNATGQSCCHPYDTTFVSREDANSAQIGSVLVGNFPSGTYPVAVNKILETEDPQGRPVLTKYGCLFRRSST